MEQQYVEKPLDKQLTILVIDDDDLALESLSLILRENGYRVLVAASGSEGLELYRECTPDIVLVDLQMPGAGGMWVVDQIHRESPQTPLLLVSGTRDIQDAIEGQRYGAWDMVLKPIEPLSLTHALDRAIERQGRLLHGAEQQRQLEQEVDDRSNEARENNGELRALNARLQQLLHLIGTFSPNTDYHQLTAQLLTHFALDMTASGGRFYEVEEGGLRLVHEIKSAAPDFLPFPLPRGSLLDRVMTVKKPLLLSTRREADESLDTWGESQDGTVMAFPFAGERGDVLAIIVLLRLGEVPFRGQDLKLGGILASFCSGSLRAARTTEELRRSEQRYRDLVHHARSILLRLDPQGRIRFFNEFGQRFFGFQEQQVVGKGLIGTLVPPTPENEAQLQELLREIQQQPEKHAGTEQLCRCRNGRRVWIAWTHRALLDENKKLAGILCVGTDITDRKRIEEALAEERDRLQSFMDTSPIAIMVVNRTGKMIQANTQAKLLLDNLQDPVETLNWQTPGASWTDWDGSPLKADQMPLRRIMQIRKPISDIRLALARPQGRRTLLSANCAPIFDDNNQIIGMIAALQDVSQRLALEDRLRQAQKMETVGQLAGGVAHDFNNLLLPIIGFSEMLLNQIAEDHPLREQISLIYRAGERAKHLTRQLLAFSRKQVFEIEWLDLNALIGGFQKMLGRTIRENIDMQFVPSNRLGQCRGDASQIEQVLMNLVINAQHAMPEGGKLIIETADVDLDEAYADSHPEVVPGGYVMLAVSDTGCGMDKETQRHIFEPFFTTKKEGEGTGLGLATVYGIVRQHNGSIWVYSEVEKGTTFKIYLPRQKGEEAREMARRARKPPRGTETILLAEDDDLVRTAAASILSQHGYTVIDSDDPVRALQLSEEHDGPIQLLLSDVIMPMWNGRDLYQRVQKLRPELRVVFMSGYTERAISHYGVLDEGVHFIQKPFTSLSLLTAVRDALDEGL